MLRVSAAIHWTPRRAVHELGNSVISHETHITFHLSCPSMQAVVPCGSAGGGQAQRRHSQGALQRLTCIL